MLDFCRKPNLIKTYLIRLIILLLVCCTAKAQMLVQAVAAEAQQTSRVQSQAVHWRSRKSHPKAEKNPHRAEPGYAEMYDRRSAARKLAPVAVT